MGEPLFQVIFLYFLFFLIVRKLFSLIQKRIKGKILMIIYIIILLSPSLLYVPIEVNTYLYGYQFKNIQIENGYDIPTIYYKIFSISDNEAKLFYVQGENGEHRVGNFFTFVKENGTWKYHGRGSTVWSKFGSASEFTIPPYF